MIEYLQLTHILNTLYVFLFEYFYLTKKSFNMQVYCKYASLVEDHYYRPIKLYKITIFIRFVSIYILLKTSITLYKLNYN